ncbi:MAG: translation initiation factor IF-3 C-terminal domain-containing protein, partial [Spirochaetia bacterium]|nr:translation initiation factor IF-3 C-terminal domain-containing protein [Spirochaetia bacterium]
TKHVKEFLDEGNTVKITVRFKGRQLAHTEIGRETLEKILELLNGEYVLDKAPMMEGRYMSMLLSPKGKK